MIWPDERPPRRYLLNALFDLELGGYPAKKVHRSVAEMSVLFLPFCRPEDAIILKVETRPEYLSYLRENGVVCGTGIHVQSVPDRTRDWQDVAWGWNNEAVAVLGSTAANTRPDCSIVKKINNRLFCYTISQTLGFGVPGSLFCGTVSEFATLLNMSSVFYPLVIKPAFGSSGFGLQVAVNRTGLQSMLPHVERYCAHGGCVVEPWCNREYDVSTGAVIAGDGSVSQVYMHRQWVNRYGAFFGICIEPDDPLIAVWKDRLSEMTDAYVAGIAAEGYFGPVGIDSFVYRDVYGEQLLAAGIEINARFTMGSLAHHLQRKMVPDGHFLLRFTGRKKCHLPENYHDLQRLLGDNCYNPLTHAGILLLTPLSACYLGVWQQPQHAVFAIAGGSAEQLGVYDAALQKAFGENARTKSED